MPTRNVNLTDHFDQFVQELVASGRFKNASEVMRAGLRLLEESASEETERLALLHSLATEGFEQLDQGQGIAIDGEARLTQRVGAIGRRAARKTSGRSTRR